MPSPVYVMNSIDHQCQTPPCVQTIHIGFSDQTSSNDEVACTSTSMLASTSNGLGGGVVLVFVKCVMWRTHGGLLLMDATGTI